MVPIRQSFLYTLSYGILKPHLAGRPFGTKYAWVYSLAECIEAHIIIAYLRAALVISPTRNSLSITCTGPGGFERALSKIGETRSAQSTVDETDLVEFVLTKSDRDSCAIAKAVTSAACQWKDSALWVRAMMVCCTTGGVTVVPEADIFGRHYLVRLGYCIACVGPVLIRVRLS